MARIAEVIVSKSPSFLSPLNDIWGNTLGLGLSTSNSSIIGINSNNFKYFTEVTIFDYDDEIKILGIFTSPPRPLDGSSLPIGYGAISTSSILRSYLNTKVLTMNTTSYTGLPYPLPSSIQGTPYFTGPIVRYNMSYGFQYNPNLPAEAIIVNIGGNDFLGFTFSQIHPFDSNQTTIRVVSDNSYLSGLFGINTSGLGSYSLATTTAYTASMGLGTNLATVIEYSQTDGTVGYFYGFDGVFDYEYYSSIGQSVNYVNTLILDGTNPLYPNEFKFLSNYPNWGPSICDWDFFGNSNGFNPTGSSEQFQCFGRAKRMRTTDFDSLSVICDVNFIIANTPSIYYNFYDSSYNLVGTNSIAFNLGLIPGVGTTELLKWDVPIGFGNLVLNNLIPNPSQTEYIVTWIGDATPTTLYTEARYFYIDRTCTIYEPVQVVFKNRLGAWEYFTFTQDKKKNHRITRNQYKKQINWGTTEGYGGDFFNNGSPRGNRIISNKIEEEFTLSSNWITEIEYEWLSELIESTDVYIYENKKLFGDNQFQVNLVPAIPIIITDTAYEFKTFNRDQIFNLTINYKLANDKPTQMI